MFKRKPSWIGILLVLTVVFSFATVFAAAPILPAPINNIQIIQLDGSAGPLLNVAQAPPLVPFDATFIGNARSHIFHYADCRYVGRMSESNKVYFDDRDEAIDAGYRPCKVCQP